jgi:hypothetical protein
MSLRDNSKRVKRLLLRAVSLGAGATLLASAGCIATAEENTGEDRQAEDEALDPSTVEHGLTVHHGGFFGTRIDEANAYLGTEVHDAGFVGTEVDAGHGFVGTEVDAGHGFVGTEVDAGHGFVGTEVDAGHGFVGTEVDAGGGFVGTEIDAGGFVGASVHPGGSSS